MDAQDESRSSLHTALSQRGHQVHASPDLISARNSWSDGAFNLLLVVANSETPEFVSFCEEVKRKNPRQIIAIVFDSNAGPPELNCASLMFTKEPEEYLVARVEALLFFNAQFPS